MLSPDTAIITFHKNTEEVLFGYGFTSDAKVNASLVEKNLTIHSRAVRFSIDLLILKNNTEDKRHSIWKEK